MSVTRIKTLVPVVSTLYGAGGTWIDYGNNSNLTGYGSAAVFDDHGNILIGFPSKYYDSGSGLVAWCGAVYVQNPETADLVQLIYPEAADILAYGMFGYTIACSGNWMVVGEAYIGSRVPHIHFYEWNGSAYVYRQKLKSYHAQVDTGFGGTLVMDGDLCCAGNRWSKNSETEGSIDIFRLSGGVWSEDVGSEILYPGASPGYEYFSRALGLHGNYLITSASGAWLFGAPDPAMQGTAYIYEDAGPGNPFVLRATLLPANGKHPDCTPSSREGRYGQCVAIHGDIAVVSWPVYDYVDAYGHAGIGCLDIYKRDGTSWPFHQRLELPEASSLLEPSKGSAWLGGKDWGGTGQEGIQFNGNLLVAGAMRWQRGAHPGGWYPSGMLGAGFVWSKNSAGDFSPVASAPGEYAIFPGAVYGAGWPVAVNDSNRIALVGLEELDEWSTARALPEADPVDTWGGTVRIYEVSIPVGHPLYNRSFEEPDLLPGYAVWWTPVISDAPDAVADFQHSDETTRPWDDFNDSWEDNHLAETEFSYDNFVSCTYESGAYQKESFEYSWREPVDTPPIAFNHQGVFVFDASNFASVSEPFETNWGVSPWNQVAIHDLSEGTFVSNLFDAASDPHEDFEEEWGIDPRNEAAIDTLEAGTFVFALLGLFPDLRRETFETSWYEVYA